MDMCCDVSWHSITVIIAMIRMCSWTIFPVTETLASNGESLLPLVMWLFELSQVVPWLFCRQRRQPCVLDGLEVHLTGVGESVLDVDSWAQSPWFLPGMTDKLFDAKGHFFCIFWTAAIALLSCQLLLSNWRWEITCSASSKWHQSLLFPSLSLWITVLTTYRLSQMFKSAC